MEDFFRKLGLIFSNFSVFDAIDIIVTAILIYFVFAFLKKYNSTFFVFIILSLLLSAVIAMLLNLSVLSMLLKISAIGIWFLLFVIYNNEIKREIWKRTSNHRIKNNYYLENVSEDKLRQDMDEIVRAVQNLSKKNVGALIILVPNSIPSHIAESGIQINSEISSELIESIFHMHTPLHDGAMLIAGDKIVAAGCFLPLTQQVNIDKDLGTRHRAGIGITESTDVTSIIVSEESGVISIARSGDLIRYADSDILYSILEEIYLLKAAKKNMEDIGEKADEE